MQISVYYSNTNIDWNIQANFDLIEIPDMFVLIYYSALAIVYGKWQRSNVHLLLCNKCESFFITFSITFSHTSSSIARTVIRMIWLAFPDLLVY